MECGRFKEHLTEVSQMAVWKINKVLLRIFPQFQITEIEKHSNNYRLACETAKLANEIFGGLVNNPSLQNNKALIQKKIDYFREVARYKLNNGEPIVSEIKVDLKNGVVNLDYGRHFGEFSAFDMMCRGLYIDLKGRSPDGILMLPMTKFFNMGEPGCPDDEFIFENMTGEIKFPEKIDGSMIVARRLENGKLFLATRQTFYDPDSDRPEQIYTKKAKEYLDQIGTDWMDANQTYTFEVVFDESPHPAKFTSGLYILSARNHTDGASRSSDEIEKTELAGKKEPPLFFPKVYQFKSFAEVKAYTEKLENAEGFVATIRMKEATNGNTRVPGNILRIKFKTPWWFATNRVMMAANKYAKVSRLVNSLPQEILDVTQIKPKDAFSEERFKTVVADFSKYLNDRFDGYLGGADDLCAEIFSHWQSASELAKRYMSESPGASYGELKKKIFTDPNADKKLRPYVGSLVDLYHGKGTFNIAHILRLYRDYTEKD